MSTTAFIFVASKTLKKNLELTLRSITEIIALVEEKYSGSDQKSKNLYPVFY